MAWWHQEGHHWEAACAHSRLCAMCTPAPAQAPSTEAEALLGPLQEVEA